MMKIVIFLICLAFGLGPVIAQTADSSSYFYQKGLDEKNKRLFLVAYNDLEKAVKQKPGDIAANREFGLTAVELRKYEVAIQTFQKIIQLSKDDLVATENLAQLYYWMHQWPQAIQTAEKCQQLHSAMKWNYIIGKSAYEQEDYGQCIKYLQAAAIEDSSNAEIPYLMARAYVDMNNYKPAIPFFLKAISLDSTRNQWIYECALTYATIYDDKSAIKFYQMAAERGYKKDNDFYENLSDSYIAAGQPEKGLELMLRVLVKKPADLDLLYSIANTYYRLKKYPEAIDYWDRILEYDKGNAKALYMIGMSYQKKGETDKGRQLCDRAIQMDPSLKNLKQEKKIDM